MALAAERNWDLVEMNASEARNQSAVERVAGRASLTHSLEAAGTAGRRGRTLILLDEADCLTGGRTTEGSKVVREPVGLRSFLEGRYGAIGALNAAWGLTPSGRPRPFEDWASVPKSPGNAAWGKLPAARKDLDDWRDAGRVEETGDRGGMGAISKLVRTTRQPLVLTVNDDRPLQRYSPVFRTSARTIRFGPVSFAELCGRLRAVARSEGFQLAVTDLEAIATRSRGDLRAALNDLEAVSLLPPGTSPSELWGTRDLASDFASLTEEVLSRARYYRSVEVRDRLDAPPDDLLPWVEENVPWFAPDGAHRDAALAVVGTAELFLARARRWRTYGLWSYASELLTGGVSLTVRDRPASSPGQALFPTFLGEMGRSRVARAVRGSLVAKLGARLHLSRAKSRSIALPFLEALFGLIGGGRRAAEAKRVVRELIAELGLTAEEVGALLGVEASSPLLRELLPPGEADARRTAEAGGADEPGDAGGGRRQPASRPAVQRQLGDWGRS